MATWELFRDGVKEQDLINVQYIDSANPFGDYIIAQVEDNLGQKFDKFEYATEIEVTVTPEGGTQISKFVGFVVERRENDQQGQDVLEVEAYSFDQFLRQNDVSNDQSGKLISDAIQDIVQTDTPVSFNAAKVNVVDDFELRRSLQDERVETALQILSFESGNEGFGVDDSLEFFFRPRERDTIARGIDNTEWFNYDIPERGKEAINEVEVRFDNGDRSVVVDKGSQKLEIQESLNLPEPATQRARIARPSITNAQDAESEGRRFLKLKNVTLTGTITTFGLFNAEPLDVISAEIIPRGIDSEFVITQVEYNWGRDETELSIVENRGFDEDLFVRLSEKTERIDLRETDPQAVEDRVVSTDVGVNVNTEITADGVTFESTTTNDAVDLMVAGFRGGENPITNDIVVGDTATSLSRSDSELENQTNSATPSRSFPNSKTVEFTASITETNVREIGTTSTNGVLLSRGIVDNPVNISGQVTVTVTIDDASGTNSVVTDAGQTAARDIIADNNPQTPTRYAFGASQTQPTETDTSLTNEIQNTKLSRTQLQNIDTPSEFESATPPISDDSPLNVDQLNGAVTLDPVTYLTEGENVDDFNGDFFQANANLSDGGGIDIGEVDGFVEFRFTLNQDVPVNKLFAGSYVLLNGWEGEVTYTFDGVQYRRVTFNSSTTKNNSAQGTFAGVNNTTLREGTTHTLRAETTAFGTGDYVIDMMFAFDDRFNINVDASSFNGNTYANPELFPDSVPVSFTDVNARRSLTELEVFQSWNNTNNSAAVTLNLGSQSKTVNNPTRNANGNIRETITVSPSNSSRTGGIDITLSRFSSANGETPRDGDKPQRMSFHNLDGNPDAVTRSNIGEATTRAFFQSGFLTGNTLREAGQKAGADLLTHSIFADVDPDNDNIIGSEQIKFIPK
ncbi:hypothetical protein OSG_eHP42_00105 [environmental Halophage eHP-42]|nr:hypothetical protein OSG_eHP42_00105 [environmental Halophage eHP-42]